MHAGNSDDTDEDFQSSEIPYLTLRDRVREWWAKATGPVYRVEHASLGEAVRERVLMWVPVVLPLVVAVLAIGAYVFTGWRAQDLASKAVASAEAGNFRLASIQIESARQLRSKHPAILKAQALVASMAGDPSCVDLWEKVSIQEAQLSPVALATRAEALIKFGNTGQREQALADLDAAGLPVKASVARTRLAFHSGSLEDAVLHARKAVAADPAPENKLVLARALMARHRPFLRTAGENLSEETKSAIEEARNLIDSLADTPQGHDALALGLVALTADPALSRKWANKAWQTQSTTNPALLPAASALIASGEMPRNDVIAKLRFVFAGSPLPQRAALAEWLMTQGEAQIVLDTISARDAAQHPAAFIAYTKALARQGDWDRLLASANEVARVPEPVRLLAVAYAAKETRKSGMAEKATLDALKAAAGTSLLGPTIVATEGLELDELVDESIISMCADAAIAGPAFAAARQRFERTGRREKLELAFDNARKASPAAESVADYGRYVDLLAGRPVDRAATAAAIESNKNNPALRMTHALALLKNGQPDEAFRVFDDFTLFFDTLSPSAQAVVTAIWGAQGDAAGAADLARRVDTRKISPDERALISAHLDGRSGSAR
jgi:tetratricopeptide (TPR) repeat protein